MTMQAAELVSSLDIWGIVQNELTQFEEYAVDEAWLHLEIDGDSFVDVAYYDISKLVYNENEPKKIRVNLTDDNINKMYNEVDKLVSLPVGLKSLHVHLNKEFIPEFEVTFVPVRAK